MEDYTPAESPPGALPAQWRQRAEGLRRYSVPAANAYEDAASELDAALQMLGEETLTLTQAAAACGYSADHIGSLVRKGQIPNAGRPNAPRVCRTDLPTKASTAPGRPPRKAEGSVDIIGIINRNNPTTGR